MKKLKSLSALLIIILCCISFKLNSQQGQTGVGLRIGTDPGITVKHFIRQNGAIEGILHTGYRGLLITGLYEWHKPIGNADAPGLKLYGGVGAHFGIFNRYAYYRKGYYVDEVIYVYNRPSAGLDGIMGIEYDFADIPLNIGLDLRPVLDMYAGFGYVYLDGALSLRVLF